MALKPGQARCINTLDRSLVVAAGAGSGKTFTLTKRIVHAIESGAVDGIDRVCAITFTNKAAGELKSRIKAELRACGLTSQALAVDEAWVSTIHGMCARILRAHALELDLDPAFKMVDPADAAILRDRAIEEVLRCAQAGDAAFEDAAGVKRDAVDALFAEYPARSTGLRGTSVESMLRTLMSYAGSSPLGFESLRVLRGSINPASLVDAVAQSFEALADATLAQKPSETRERWVADVQENLGSIRADMVGANASDALWCLRALDRLPLPKRVGTADYKVQVSEAVDLYQACAMELRLACAAVHLQTLIALARIAEAFFSNAKRAAGVLDNDDLLVGAFRAVSEHPSIAALYADKFQLVMVDEFQDTDQMQVDMIKKLSGPGACRLCTVGDAQQSIYRFRGADVGVYRRHLEEVRTVNPEDVILLPDNFRSHPDVLSLVDRVFERPEMFGGEFMSLAPGRDESRVKRPFAEGVPRVQVQLTTNSYKGAPSDKVREVAAERIADAFADLHDRGHSAGEMAVLLGGMTHADVYAAALRSRGIACVISGGSVFARGSEVQVIGDLTRIAANPAQTQALNNVLTGPLFDLCADDLLEIATYTGRDGSYRRSDLDRGLRTAVQMMRSGDVPAEWSPRLTLAVRVLGDFLGGVGRSKVSRLIMRAIVDSGWLSRLEQAGPEGLASAANAYKAVRLVADIEDDAAAGPARVARVFQSLLDESKEAPGALSATGGDFVRIMTVHASKGLEFPIVAVAEFRTVGGPSDKLLAGAVGQATYLSLDLGNTVSSLDGPAKLKDLPGLYASMMEGRVDEGELAQAVERADRALALRAALFERERVGDEEEAKRLLYVALTRAKEALIVSLAGKRSKDNPNGTPKSCLGAVADVLAGKGEGFAPGVSNLEYGGSKPALVEHIALEPEGDESETQGVPSGSDGKGDSPAFEVPAATERVVIHRRPYAPAHEGVFSYSSISDASHEGDALELMASRFFVSADAPEGGWDAPSAFPVDASSSVVADEEGRDASGSDASLKGKAAWKTARNAAVADEDDGSWAFIGSSCADSDRATDLGTAFHRLAQYAVATRDGGPLMRPPRDRIESLARSCKLDGVQMARLTEALERWFSSDVASRMSEFHDLRAELPFFVNLRGSREGSRSGPEREELQGDIAFLEGEIDLIGFDIDGSHAVVVDYKTGGNAQETERALSRKHVLQAACYAYAIMRQGVSSVEAVFVRVERGREDDPMQPQCVRYRFEAADMAYLENVISEAYESTR